jgi:hypothetical protein
MELKLDDDLGFPSYSVRNATTLTTLRILLHGKNLNSSPSGAEQLEAGITEPPSWF